MPDEGAPNPAGQLGAIQQKSLKKLHLSQWCQLGIALGFALLFLAAVVLKVHGQPESGMPKLSVEGQLEIDPGSKLKLSK
jgi:hypothetical protein